MEPNKLANRNCGRFPYFSARTETRGLRGRVSTIGEVGVGGEKYPSAPTTKSWYPESSATRFTGTSSCAASATVAGAIMGPGHAAKMMLLKKMITKASSRFHVGQSYAS